MFPLCSPIAGNLANHKDITLAAESSAPTTLAGSAIFVSMKNPCDFGCFYRLVFRTVFNLDYLIFSRFHLKNRITTKPAPESLFFNDFNARRGIAGPNCNAMVTDGNYLVRIHKRKRTIGQHLHARQRLFLANIWGIAIRR